MHDIRLIRENPAGFDAMLARRGLSPVSSEILSLDAERRDCITRAEAALAERNQASKEIGLVKQTGNKAEFEALRERVAAMKDEIAALEAEAKAKDAELTEILLGLPNAPHDDVPDGADEADNVELRRWGTPRAFDFAPREHFEIPAVAAGLDLGRAAKLSGSRFMVLTGSLVRLHRALAQFMLDVHITENGLTEVWTPVLVRDEAMLGTGQLPKFGSDLFFGASDNARSRIMAESLRDYAEPADLEALKAGEPLETVVGRVLERAPTREDLWLIPTAEVTLTNLVAGEIVTEASLPRRMTAHSQCFRSEAGSAGKDVTGILRQHQFEKVEMVSITRPEDSRAELDRMTRCAEDILERLGLPYRTVVLCTGDMGFGARRTHDIEVWLPGQDTYREISSCSVCGDFQARRMNARFRREGEKRPEFVHTLNGSGLAVGRALIAVVENGQEADGSVTLPAVLAPYMGGATRIGPDGALG